MTEIYKYSYLTNIGVYYIQIDTKQINILNAIVYQLGGCCD